MNDNDRFKFRVWDENNNCYLDEWNLRDCFINSQGELVKLDEDYCDGYRLMDNCIIEQCTGLSAAKSYRGDKPEDLLVWEGDIGTIYKKKMEKIMTHDEIKRRLINFNQIVNSLIKGKTIQREIDGQYCLCNNHLLRDMTLGNIYFFRVKPEPKVIPWTHRDADEFSGMNFRHKDYDKPGNMTVLSWHTEGMIISRSGFTEYYTFEQVKDDFIADNGNPCGKVVEE